MTALVIVLLVVVGFFWMFNHSVKAGYGKFLFWLLWFIFGLCAVLSLPPEPGLVARMMIRVMIYVWMAGVFGLPIYWLLRRSRNHYLAAPPTIYCDGCGTQITAGGLFCSKWGKARTR